MEQKVVITDVDIPFDRLVILIVKINLAVLGFALALGMIFLAVSNILFGSPLVFSPLALGLIVIVGGILIYIYIFMKD